jgi:hypothetical protein
VRKRERERERAHMMNMNDDGWEMMFKLENFSIGNAHFLMSLFIMGVIIYEHISAAT